MTKVVALWLNYNSSKIWDVVKGSLHSILNLERGNFDLTILIADGGSTDGSLDLIRKYVSEVEAKNEVVIHKLPENRGYSGNMNGGYEYAVNNLGADYVAFLNNDFIVEGDSLRNMFEWLLREGYVGVQGLELRPDGLISNAGMFHDEFGQVIGICGSYKIDNCGLIKPYFITYPMGSYMLYSVDFINELPDKKPFITETFTYFDDNYLGLMAWQRSQKVAFVPVIEGIHYGSLTTKSVHGTRARSMASYFNIRNRTALRENMRCRYHTLFRLYKSRLYLMAKLGLLNDSLRRGIFDGFKLAEIVRGKAGVIDLEKAVHVEFPRSHYLASALIPGYKSMTNLDAHIKYLSKYIKYPDWLVR